MGQIAIRKSGGTEYGCKTKAALMAPLLKRFMSVYARILGTRGLRERLSPIERTRS